MSPSPWAFVERYLSPDIHEIMTNTQGMACLPCSRHGTVRIMKLLSPEQLLHVPGPRKHSVPGTF